MESRRAGIGADASDGALVARLITGDETALGAIYDRYAGEVYGVAMRVERDSASAEEIVQETFLVLWDRAELFDPERGSLGGWLSVIARNRAIDRRRASTRRPSLMPFSAVLPESADVESAGDRILAVGRPIGIGTTDVAPDEAMVRHEGLAALAVAVADLPDAERAAIVLAYRDGLTQSEIATRLGWPLGTVKTRSRRALGRLRGRLAAPHGGRMLDDRPQVGAASVGRNALAGCCPPA